MPYVGYVLTGMDASRQIQKSPRVGAIHDVKLEVPNVGKGLQKISMAEGEVIERNHWLILCEQPAGEINPNEPRAARNQMDSHTALPPGRHSLASGYGTSFAVVP
jgi:hypothetical protein